jgi:Zn-dependent peptidase ImmA (M78 family)
VAQRSKAALARLAVEVRKQDLGLTEYQRLCPYELAEVHGVAVYTLEDLVAVCSTEAIAFFTYARPEAWSAALVPNGTGQFIVENSTHNRLRRRSNLAHEMAHLLLEHEFDTILFAGDERGCKDPNYAQVEAEAVELSGELLLPSSAAKRAAINGWSDQDVADRFDISVEFARWRMGVSGARLIAARAARKRGR